MIKLSGLQTEDFESLYDKYSNKLYRLALSTLRSDADAKDVIQDVFIAYLQKWIPFVDTSHEEAWLVRVTINKCRDCLRKNKIRETIPIEDLFDYGIKDKEALILQEVMALEENYKTPVLLYYFEDYSVKEISKILKISESAVKMRLSRARDMLKNLLSGGV